MSASTQPVVDPRMLRILDFEDLHVGMRESLMKTVMDSDVVGYARLSGDENPLHLCDVYAAGTRLPGPGAVYRSQTLNFHGPVKIGDVVEVVVEVAELIPKGRIVRLNCDATVDGKLVLDGDAVVSVPARRTPTSSA